MALNNQKTEFQSEEENLIEENLVEKSQLEENLIEENLIEESKLEKVIHFIIFIIIKFTIISIPKVYPCLCELLLLHDI